MSESTIINNSNEDFSSRVDEIITEHLDTLNSTENEESQQDNSISGLTEEEQAMLYQAVEEAHQEHTTNTEHQEIPVNSKTLLVDETTSRFSSAVWYENAQKKTIILAGCGGIGSWVALLLARLKPASMFLYDDDRVETVNMAGQLYKQSDVEKSKVSAIAGTIAEYANYSSAFAINERFTEESEASDIMICGFDNMVARKTFFEKWKLHVFSKLERDRKECLFIDGRLNAEEFQVLCIRGDDNYNIDRYEQNFLFSDTEADEAVCSYKQTTFCASMIASYIVNLFVNFCSNQCNPLIDRDLPFLTTYNAETIYLKTEA